MLAPEWVLLLAWCTLVVRRKREGRLRVLDSSPGEGLEAAHKLFVEALTNSPLANPGGKEILATGGAILLASLHLDVLAQVGGTLANEENRAMSAKGKQIREFVKQLQLDQKAERKLFPVPLRAAPEPPQKGETCPSTPSDATPAAAS